MTQLIQPDIRPVKESKMLYTLVADFTYGGITVPKGFRHDGASYSQLLFQRDGIHRAAALIHDYLYDLKGELPEGVFSREYADKLFKRMLKEYGVKSWHVFIAYKSVYIFGRFFWRS